MPLKDTTLQKLKYYRKYIPKPIHELCEDPTTPNEKKPFVKIVCVADPTEEDGNDVFYSQKLHDWRNNV